MDTIIQAMLLIEIFHEDKTDTERMHISLNGGESFVTDNGIIVDANMWNIEEIDFPKEFVTYDKCSFSKKQKMVMFDIAKKAIEKKLYKGKEVNMPFEYASFPKEDIFQMTDEENDFISCQLDYFNASKVFDLEIDDPDPISKRKINRPGVIFTYLKSDGSKATTREMFLPRETYDNMCKKLPEYSIAALKVALTAY